MSELSTFFFRFRLTPWSASINVNFDNEPITPGWAAVCTRDELSLVTSMYPEMFNQTLGIASFLASWLIDAHAYAGFPSFAGVNVEPWGWIEVNGVPAKRIHGYMDASLQLVPLVPGHPDNGPFKQALETVNDEALSGLRLAMADFRRARLEPSTYAAFFAFRVLEDVSYLFGDDRDRWARMNSELGTDEAHWADLTKWGTKARHRGEGISGLGSEERGRLLSLAKDALDRCVDALHRSASYQAK